FTRATYNPRELQMEESPETCAVAKPVTRRASVIFNRRSAFWIAGLAGLFVFVAWLTLHLWPTFAPQYDTECGPRHAEALLHHGEVPRHGGVASYLAFNPPGVTMGFLPWVLLFPMEPALAERAGSLFLLLLTLGGLFALLAKRFGNATAFYACAFYLLSS